MKKLFADRITGLVQNDIRRMSLECAKVNGINLGQGICDQPIEPLIKEAAIQAVRDDRSIYTRLDGIDVSTLHSAGSVPAGASADSTPEAAVLAAAAGLLEGAWIVLLPGSLSVSLTWPGRIPGWPTTPLIPLIDMLSGPRVGLLGAAWTSRLRIPRRWPRRGGGPPSASPTHR